MCLTNVHVDHELRRLGAACAKQQSGSVTLRRLIWQTPNATAEGAFFTRPSRLGRRGYRLTERSLELSVSSPSRQQDR